MFKPTQMTFQQATDLHYKLYDKLPKWINSAQPWITFSQFLEYYNITIKETL